MNLLKPVIYWEENSHQVFHLDERKSRVISYKMLYIRFYLRNKI